MLTPQAVHYGEAKAIPKRGILVLEEASGNHPSRFKGKPATRTKQPGTGRINKLSEEGKSDQVKSTIRV